MPATIVSTPRSRSSSIHPQAAGAIRLRLIAQTRVYARRARRCSSGEKPFQIACVYGRIASTTSRASPPRPAAARIAARNARTCTRSDVPAGGGRWPRSTGPCGQRCGNRQKAGAGEPDQPHVRALGHEPKRDVDHRQPRADQQQVVAGREPPERAGSPRVVHVAGRAPRPAAGDGDVARGGRPGGEHDVRRRERAAVRKRHPGAAVLPGDVDDGAADGLEHARRRGIGLREQVGEVAAERHPRDEVAGSDRFALLRQPLEQVLGPAGDAAQVRGDNVHQVPGKRGRVGHAPGQAIVALHHDDRAGRPGPEQVRSGERPGGPAADDHDARVGRRVTGDRMRADAEP